MAPPRLTRLGVDDVTDGTIPDGNAPVRSRARLGKGSGNADKWVIS